VQFIQGVSRGHQFEPYYRVEETQIVKAFQSFLDGAPPAYQKEERDALAPSVHDWDGDYTVSVFSAARDVDRRLLLKQRALDELLRTLPQWVERGRTFQQDMDLEISDAARTVIDSYAGKAARLLVGDFSALINAPISASIGEALWLVVQTRKADPKAIGAFLRSRHFAEVPTVQLSARLFSAYKERIRSERTPPDPTSNRTRERLSGFLYDIQHAATYAPYCNAYFTDNVMAKLMKHERVNVEADFGCRVFSKDSEGEFVAWLEALEAQMTPEHADDLSWAYPNRFPFD
jgi:hypothetical protein